MSSRSRWFQPFCLLLCLALPAVCDERPGFAAIVNGEKLPWSEIESEILDKPALSRYLAAARKDSLLTDELINKAIEGAIYRKILLQSAASESALDRSRIEADAHSLAEKLRRDGSRGSRRRQGEEADEKLIEKRIVSDLTVDAYIASRTRDIEVSEEEIRARYGAENEKLREKAVVRASHIFVESPGLACSEQDNEARSRIDGIYREATAPGADFMALARRYSESNTARYGGYLGRLTKGRQPSEFEEAAWSMRSGEVSRPVRTGNGYNIIWVIERRDREIPAYESVREPLRRAILAEKRETRMEELVSEALKKADLQVFWPAWNR